MSDSHPAALLEAGLIESGIFDADWYTRRYADARHSSLDALTHFLHYGWPLGRSPGPGFDPAEYCRRYADVVTSGQDPLLHFLTHGQAEGRKAPYPSEQQAVQARLAVVLHAYHLPLVEALGERLSALDEPFDLYITTPHADSTPEIAALRTHFDERSLCSAKVVVCPNRGRDIAPFFTLLPELLRYEWCLKLHTKQGVTAVSQQWRETLLNSVLPPGDGLDQLMATLRHDYRLCLAGAGKLFMSQQAMRFGNTPWLTTLAPELGIELEEGWGFFAGSMFWCRPQALARLSAKVAELTYEPESGAQDGELAHALERLVAGVVQPQAGRVLLVDYPSSGGLSLRRWAPGMALQTSMPSLLLAEKPHAAPASLAGDLNLGGSTAIRGWLADRDDPTPREALIRIDGEHEQLVSADQFRRDLRDNGVNDGCHAFEAFPPVACVDGHHHRVELVDKLSGKVLKTAETRWMMRRRFSDFSGYLAHASVDPYLARPFREEDKRCLAAMENIADSLVQAAERLDDAPLVSIIMPCFNRVETIAEAVDSVRAQTYTLWELILVDDGSTDGTRQWCEKHAGEDARISVIALAENAGVSAARNQGLAAAQGEYIAYLDSDNHWDNRYIAAMVGAFEREPTADALYSGLYHYAGRAKVPSGVLFGPLNLSLLFNRNYIDLNAFCHKREAYEQCGGFDESLPRFVDWDLIRRYSRERRLCAVPVVLTHYYFGRATNTLTANSDLSGYLEAVREKTGAFWAPLNTPSLIRGVSVVIPSYESLDDLSDCLASLLALGLGEKLEIIVVDNDSSQEVKDFLDQAHAQGQIKAILLDCNYGFTHAVNLGLQAADPKNDLMLLNNDALMKSGAIEALQSAAYQLPDCGLVVPQQILPAGTPTLTTHVPYANPEQPCDVNLSAHHANILAPGLFHDGRTQEISFAPFFCVYIPREIYQAAGPLDAQFGRHYRSDRIYCDVVRHILGKRIYHISDACVIHKLQKSTRVLSKRSDSEFDLMFKRNQWDDATRRSLGFRHAVWDR